MSSAPPRTRGKRAEAAARRWHSDKALEDLKGAPLDAYRRAVAAVGAVPGLRADLEFIRVVHATPSCATPAASAAVEALYSALALWGRRYGLPVRPGTRSLACEADALDNLENWAASLRNPVMVMTAPPLRGRDFDRDLADVPKHQYAEAWARRMKAARRSAQANAEAEADAERLHELRVEAGRSGGRPPVPPEVADAWVRRLADLCAAGLSKLAACKQVVAEANAGGPLAWPGHVVKLTTVRSRLARRRS